jgi:hypothetical protein
VRGRAPTQLAIREDPSRAGVEVGEAHTSREASNDRGAKGPWFKGQVRRGKSASDWREPSNLNEAFSRSRRLEMPKRTRARPAGALGGRKHQPPCPKAGCRESRMSGLMSGIWKRSLRATAPDLDSTRALAREGGNRLRRAPTLRELWRDRPQSPLPCPIRHNPLDHDRGSCWISLGLSGARRQISPALSKGGLLVLDEPEVRSYLPQRTADSGGGTPGPRRPNLS